jgi:peptide/nickel transport system permease protein
MALLDEAASGARTSDAATLADDRGHSELFSTLEFYIPLGGLLFIVLLCFLGPLILPVSSPSNSGLLAPGNLAPFSPGHLLGTDPLGNDIFSRILYGGRTSLEVGFGAEALGFLIGAAIGMFAAYKSGAAESLAMRAMDLLLAFPGLIIAIVIAAYLGPSELHVIWAISFFTVPSMARLARAQTLRLRQLDFIVSSQLFGTKDRRVIVRHLVPNVVPYLLTYICLGVGLAIVLETALSFLGVGIPPGQPSWGNMIQVGFTNISNNPDLILVPAAFLFVTLVCLNLLGDAVRARLSGG